MTLRGRPMGFFVGGAVWAILLCIVCAACSASVRLGEGMEKYEKDVIRLQKRLIDNPGDAEALREVGIIYLRTRRYAEAYDPLKQAYAHAPSDPRTLFYLGLASEQVGKRQAALQLYEKYADVGRFSPYRRRMEGRYEWLVRLEARDEMKGRLAREDSLSGGGRSPRIVAVFPLAYQGTSEQYAPLGRGLSEMMLVDLAKIHRLRLVERIRLQALLDELKLAQTDYVDPKTAPRVGRLLGAGRLVGGSYSVSGEELRLDVALTEEESRLPHMVSRAGALDRLFQIEKELVFRVIEALGVELTPEERRGIETVPTENLQAFLAYSRGLAREDAGQFAQAFDAYKRAAALDPDFEAAAERAEVAAGLSVAGGTPDEVLQHTLASEAAAASSINLLGHRSRLLNQSIESLFVPGLDARQPAAEAFETSLPDPPLPDPPSPPTK